MQEKGEGSNKSQQKEQQQDDEDQTPENWKVFSSEKIGFTFAYPSEWGQTELSIQDDTYSEKRFTVDFDPSATPYHVYASGATSDFVWQTEYTGLRDFGYIENNGQIRYGVMNNKFRRSYEN